MMYKSTILMILKSIWIKNKIIKQKIAKIKKIEKVKKATKQSQ